MNFQSRLLAATLVGLLSSLALATSPPIKDLYFMAGCWSYDGHDAGSIEQWMSPVNGELLGMSRIVSDNKVVAFEYMRIARNTEGQLEFVASPSGQGTTHFGLVTLGQNEVVFENPEHDFPQRIIYRLIDAQHLLGRVEGRTDEGEQHADFPMTKIACDPS